MTANAHYTITYNGDPSHGPCDANVNTLDMELLADGKAKYPSGSTSAREVDLLTVYFTQVGGSYPSPPESFTLTLQNGGGYEVKKIYKPSSCTASVTAVETSGLWTLTIKGPTQDETSDFQLFTPGATPPHKLKIRVKRQPGFSCTAGPHDNVWGGEIPNP